MKRDGGKVKVNTKGKTIIGVQQHKKQKQKEQKIKSRNQKMI